MKTAVYVEGQTELIFVREFLLKWYGSDPVKIGFMCYKLLQEDSQNQVKYSFGDKNSERFFTITDVGGDERALSKAIERANVNKINGFDRILVLRDMYSERYKEGLRRSAIDPQRNRLFINGAEKAIEARKLKSFVQCHFAIMEIEAWILGMGWYLQRINSLLTPDYLRSNLKIDLNTDPETTIYHPSKRLATIYRHIGSFYRKRSDEVNAIMDMLDKSDFERLLAFDKCESFKSFVKSITL